MNIIKKSNTPFFLTGGTALSRHYYNHRYSDDLDLFVISDSNYNNYIEIILNKLIMHESESGLRINRQSLKKFETATQFFIEKGNECKLKIDLVNDINIHLKSSMQIYSQVNRHLI